ncbi:VWA domain-containing protein [Marinomonas sp.]|nr:VWA domain-containing protein [Marinomonas sp.]MDB4837363.1 VWA domain-containing protein [Marinomonas sp.]
MTLLESIHFTRPLWLLAIPVTLFLAYFITLGGSKKQALDNVIDSNLLSHLQYKQESTIGQRWIILIVLSLCWVGLSGISWIKAPNTMLESTQKTVLVVDQSLSMYANDIKPNRLTQLKQTTRDLLSNITEGELALVAFAGEGYAISPFSQDRDTVTHFLLALEPIIMPSYGSNLADGIKAAISLLNDRSAPLHLIVLTDDVTNADFIDVPKAVAGINLKFDLIAIGTQEASNITLPDGQILKRNGRNISPKTPFEDLEKLVKSLNGRFYEGRLTSSELEQITRFTLDRDQTQEAKNKSIQWIEQGHWFAFPFLIWLAFQFRKGALFCILLCLYLSPSQHLQASPLDWFLTQDQKGQKAADTGNWQEANKRFTQPKWQGASSYALEDYPSTIEALENIDRNAADNYNLGNALALSGNIEKAIVAYEQSQKQDPSLDAAKENLAYLKKQQQQQNQQQEQESQDNQQQDGQDNNQNNQQSEDKEQQGSSDPSQKNSKEQTSEQQKDNKNKETQDKDKAPEDNGKNGEPESTDHNTAPEQTLDKEQQQALNQWLKQIQDNPGLLMQRKLWYMHQEKRNERRSIQEDERTPW